MNDKVECGSGILKEPSKRLDFHCIAISGLGSRFGFGSVINRRDMNKYAGQRWALTDNDLYNLRKDLVNLGSAANKKRGFVLFK